MAAVPEAAVIEAEAAVIEEEAAVTVAADL